MSSPEYPDTVQEYVQAQGWTTNITELREGAYMIAGFRGSGASSKKMLLMIVCEPESEVTTEHVEYLVKTAKQKNANTAALTAEIKTTDEARQVIEQYNISVIDPDTVASAPSTEITGPTNKSSIENAEPSQENGYEIYGTQWKMTLYGVGCTVFGLVVIWLLWDGSYSEASLIETLAIYLSPPFFLFGGGLLLYQAIKNDPILRITEQGIYFNKPIGSSEFYPWDDIEGIGRVEQQVKSSTQIHLQIRVSDLNHDSSLIEILDQFGKAAIGDDSDAHYIPMSSYAIDFEEVAKAVNQYSDVPVTTDI